MNKKIIAGTIIVGTLMVAGCSRTAQTGTTMDITDTAIINDEIKDTAACEETTRTEDIGGGIQAVIGVKEKETEVEVVEKGTTINDGKDTSVTLTEVSSMKYKLVTEKDGETTECELTDIFFSTAYEFAFVGENKVKLRVAQNPDLETLIIYDTEKNTFEVYYGTEFIIDGENADVYYVTASPHWSDESEKVPDQLMLGDKTIITAESGQEITDITMSDDGLLYFYMVNSETEEKEKLEVYDTIKEEMVDVSTENISIDEVSALHRMA